MRKIFLLLSIVLACATSVWAQNTVSFDNQSGEPALVKLIGPTQTEVQVPNGTKTGTDAVAGQYIIKVRYGTPGNYRYSKGEAFEVKETATSRSEITITLHKVVAGNYDSEPISERDFGKTDATAPATSTKTRVETDNTLLEAAKYIGNADQDSTRFSVKGRLVGDVPSGAKTIMINGYTNRLMLVNVKGGLCFTGIAKKEDDGRFKADVYRAALLRADEQMCVEVQITTPPPMHTESYQVVNTNGTRVVFKSPGADKTLDLGDVMIKTPSQRQATPEPVPPGTTAKAPSGLAIVAADATSANWPLVKQEKLTEFQGATPPPSSTFIKLYFANDGLMLKMSFQDEGGTFLRIYATETTPKFASAVVEVGKTTKTIQYRLSKQTSMP